MSQSASLLFRHPALQTSDLPSRPHNCRSQFTAVCVCEYVCASYQFCLTDRTLTDIMLQSSNYLQIRHNPSQNPCWLFCRNWQIDPKNHMEIQGTQNIQKKKKKNKFGRLTFSNFKMYYKGTVIKIVWYWHKDRHLDQWKRIESPEVDPHTYEQLTSSRVPWQFNGEITVFSTNGAETVRYSYTEEWSWGNSLAVQWLRLHASTAGGTGSIPGRGIKISHAVWRGNINKQINRMKLDLCFTPYTKITSKWIKDLNVRAKTIKLLEENRCKFLWLSIRQWFLGYDTKSTSN